MSPVFCVVNRTNARSLKKDSRASKKLGDETGILVLSCSVKLHSDSLDGLRTCPS